MKKTTGTDLKTHICPSSSSWGRLEGKLTSYCQVESLLLTKYATDDVIDEADIDITRFKCPDSQKVVEYVQVLRTQAYIEGEVKKVPF